MCYNKYVPQLPKVCHICKLCSCKIQDYVRVYHTSYELNAINNVTRSSGIHTFHITGLCPWTNMPATLHNYVPLHYYCILNIYATLLHTSIKKSINCYIYLPYYYIIYASKYAPQMPQIWHAPKLCDIHLVEKYANIHATHKVAPINKIARLVVHRCWHRKMMIMPHPNYIYWVGHLAKSVERKVLVRWSSDLEKLICIPKLCNTEHKMVQALFPVHFEQVGTRIFSKYIITWKTLHLLRNSMGLVSEVKTLPLIRFVLETNCKTTTVLLNNRNM